MQNIQGFGTFMVLRASETYPTGIVLTELADDTDPFDIADLTIADTGMGVNGDLVVWSSANPIEVTIAVIPGGPDDQNLATLMERNRPAKNKFVAN